MDIGSRKQLFVDDAIVESSNGIELAVNRPGKEGAAIVADRLWESGRVGTYSTVLHDGSLFRCYYDCTDRRGNWYYALALSVDGIHWHKPDLGLVEFRDSKANNILNLPANGCVFTDPGAPAEERFKYLAVAFTESSASEEQNRRWKEMYRSADEEGVHLFYSSDGVEWESYGRQVFPFVPDTHNMAFFDRRLNRYVAYLRGWWPPGEGRLRTVVRYEADDLTEPWQYDTSVEPYDVYEFLDEPHLPTVTKELPTVIEAGEGGPAPVDVYNPAVVQYEPDLYVAFPSFYRHFPDPPAGKYPNDGVLDLHFLFSRDGVEWHRPSPDPYVRLGAEGEPDSRQMYMSVGLIEQGGRLFQYYVGYDWTHGDQDMDVRPHSGALIRLAQRVDGFVSADASRGGGEIVTKPLAFAGSRMEVNVDASALGGLDVELQSAEGQVLNGYSAEQCDTVEGNQVAATVRWGGNSDVSSLAGRQIRARFVMRSAKLFAFRFVSCQS